MKLLSTFLFLALIMPVAAFAQDDLAEFSNLTQLFINIQTFINGVLVPVIFTLAFIIFLFGVFKTFILGASDEEKQKEGKQIMLYSIIGFVIMVSLWGIVNLFAQGLGLENETGTDIPTIEIPIGDGE